MTKPQALIAAYETKRAARGKPVVVEYNGNGTYTVKTRVNLVPYTLTTAELKARISA